MFFTAGFGPSPVEKLLDQLEGKDVQDPVEGPIVLRSFLDEEDLLPELRADNSRLIDYLSQKEILEELIGYSMNKPVLPEEADRETVAKHSFKYPHVASEVLSAELVKITDGVVGNPDLMTQIFSLLDAEDGINPIQANNFSKVVVSFLRSKNAETMQSMAQRDNFMIGLLRNANAAPIADMIVRILDNPETDRPFSTIVEPPSHEAVRLLADSDILLGLGDTFVATIEGGGSLSQEEERSRYETIENVASAIVGLTSRVLQLEQAHYSMPDNLNIFHNAQIIGRILDTALDGDLEDTIVRHGLLHGLNVTIELLTTELNLCSANRPKNEEEQNQMNQFIRQMVNARSRSQTVGSSPMTSPKSTSSTNREQLMSTFLLERELRSRLQRLLKLLQTKSQPRTLQTSAGIVEQPIGSLRLKTVEFFVATLKSGGEDLLAALLDSDVPNLLLDLFFSHEWSSILHHVIASAILSALDPEECRNTTIQKTWLRSYLVKQLMVTYSNYKDKKNANNLYRNGFIGHVVQLATKVEDFLSNFDYRPNKVEFVKEDVLDEFEKFCEEHLAEEKRRESAPLGGERPGNSNRTVSDDGPNDEATEVFGMDEVMDELSSGGENNEAMRHFAAYLMNNSNAADYDSDDDDDLVDGDQADDGAYGDNSDDERLNAGHGDADDDDDDEDDDSGDEDYEQFVSTEMESTRNELENSRGVE